MSVAPTANGKRAPVLDPEDPMRSAREFVQHGHITPEGLVTLRHQGSEFFTYARDESCYVAMPRESLRSGGANLVEFRALLFPTELFQIVDGDWLAEIMSEDDAN